MDKNINIKVKVWRQRGPEVKGAFETYDLQNISQGSSFLEMLDILNERKIYLAVQGCEHINRALAVERELAEKYGLEIVNVLPGLHAGGSAQLAAFKYMRDPVEVEFITAHAGLDIGDTSIGMHIKHVQIPLRPQQRELGSAHVCTLASRPRLIGGERAGHYKDSIRRV